jgi:hypothetical protein
LVQFRDFQSNGSIDWPPVPFFNQQSKRELDIDLSTSPPEVTISLGDIDLKGELLETMLTNKEITQKEASIVTEAISTWLDGRCADEQVKLSPKAKEMITNLLIAVSRRITAEST